MEWCYLDNPSGFITIAPEKFVLPDKINNLGSFEANVFAGHFEKKNSVYLTRSKLKIKRVVYFRKFDLEQPKRDSQEQYIVFGDSSQAFTAKKVQEHGADFDELRKIESPPVNLIKSVSTLPHIFATTKDGKLENKHSPILFNDSKTMDVPLKTQQFYFYGEDLK